MCEKLDQERVKNQYLAPHAVMWNFSSSVLYEKQNGDNNSEHESTILILISSFGKIKLQHRL